MKILFKIMLVIIILLKLSNSVYSMSIDEIMNPNFQLKEYAFSLYDMFTKTGKNNKYQELKVATLFVEKCTEIIDRPGLTHEYHEKACKDLIAGCIVGIYFTNKYFYKKDMQQIKKYHDFFWPRLTFGCYQLGAIDSGSEKNNNLIANRILLPILKVLAEKFY